MNSTMKQRIISELDDLTDRKAYSLLDYLHFLKQEQEANIPNKETLDSIDELESDTGELNSYSSAAEMFDDLGIDR